MRKISFADISIFIVNYIFNWRFRIAKLTKQSKIIRKIIDKGLFEDDDVTVIPNTIKINKTIEAEKSEFIPTDILKEIDEEITKLQTELISEKDYQKLQNKFDNNFVSSNSSIEGIAENLASYYLLYGDINLINTEIEMIHSITREEIRDVAKKYLNPNQRLVLDYVPAAEKAK